MNADIEPGDELLDSQWTEEHRISRFRNALLGRTLRYVADNIPYYRAFRDRADLDLADFPFIDSALFREREEEFLNLETFPDELLTTGGTSGSPGLLYGSALDRRILYRHLYGRQGGSLDPELLSEGFVIHVDTAHHGFALHPGGGVPIAHLPLQSPAHAELIWRIIRDGLVVQGTRVRANCLIASISLIRILSEFLRAAGIRPGGELVFLCGTSWHTPQLLQEELAEFWKARVVASYGLSEFSNAPMFPCAECGARHIPDIVYPEFFTPDKEMRVRSGVGALVLTSLFPFVRLQPRIRYWTGDLVAMNPACPATGRPGITFVGRANHCLLAAKEGRLQVVFSPLMVSDALFALPHARHDYSNYQFYMEAQEPPLSSPFRPGRAMFGFRRFDAAANEVEVALELDFVPSGNARLADKMQQQFLGAVQEQIMRSRGTVTLHATVLGPGELRKQGIPPVRV